MNRRQVSGVSQSAAAIALAAALIAGGCGPKNTRIPIATNNNAPPSLLPSPAPTPDCPTPTVTLTANADTITVGQASTLVWDARNATTLTIAPAVGGGALPMIGNRQISPQSSVTYTATATSNCGSTSGVARITVNPATAPLAQVRSAVDSSGDNTAKAPGNTVEPVNPTEPTIQPRPVVSGPTFVDSERRPSTGATPNAAVRTPSFAEAVQNVLFDYDQAELRADQIARLQADAAWLRQNPGVRFTVEGHADERGNQEYNLALGVRRANTVAQFLVSQGVSESRIGTVSFGKERPLCKNSDSDESCHQQNRRAAFTPQQ